MAQAASTLQAAERYQPCDDLWFVTAYFNSTHSRNRQANYHTFAESLRQSKLNLVTVECAFGDDEYELPADVNTVRVRSRDVLWQKERLLNLAIQHVPPQIRKVAWLDCDVLFANPTWAVETSRLLDTLPVVQIFEQVVRLPPGRQVATREDNTRPSFASIVPRDPSSARLGSERHGLTGFGWAYRREILDAHGLYDGGIIGDGDHMMAHAMMGDFSSECVQNIFQAWPEAPVKAVQPGAPKPTPTEIGPLHRLARRWVPRRVKTMLGRQPVVPRLNPIHLEHFRQWGEPFYADVQGRVGHTSGTILHLWHGSHANRQHSARRRFLVENDYSPTLDVRLNESGCWEWSSDKPALHAAVEDYFYQRREDDNESQG